VRCHVLWLFWNARCATIKLQAKDHNVSVCLSVCSSVFVSLPMSPFSLRLFINRYLDEPFRASSSTLRVDAVEASAAEAVSR